MQTRQIDVVIMCSVNLKEIQVSKDILQILKLNTFLLEITI